MITQTMSHDIAKELLLYDDKDLHENPMGLTTTVARNTVGMG